MTTPEQLPLFEEPEPDLDGWRDWWMCDPNAAVAYARNELTPRQQLHLAVKCAALCQREEYNRFTPWAEYISWLAIFERRSAGGYGTFKKRDKVVWKHGKRIEGA